MKRIMEAIYFMRLGNVAMASASVIGHYNNWQQEHKEHNNAR